MYSLIVNSFKPTPAVRRILPCAFYHPQATHHYPQVHSTTKVDDFYITSSYPDDSEAPPQIKQRRTSVHAAEQWQESTATQSEADVKADRNEAVPKEAMLKPEEREPTLDEM
ncbi:hypothetical protein BJX61DRAFT_212743 [Aspergillus egyptiacus]|nr:hypothetical protein BJX61DRAFT_212743 [Aspergillus egyptiacus]